MTPSRFDISSVRALSIGLLALAAVSCNKAPPEPTPDPDYNSRTKPAGDTKAASTTTATAQPPKPKPAGKKVVAKPVASVTPSPDDPLKGVFKLEDATKGLPAGKALTATIETDIGTLECKLFDDKAPITVANFIGLARGVRPWKTPEKKWEKKAAYDGTIFHRIIKGFMIQGGDPNKDGSGGPGYVIPDEVWEDANHDRAGLLCMANRGPNTNGAQFFITDDAAAHLDNGYTIFGECGPVDQVHKIANVPVDGESPKQPPVIKKVTISRK
jgi:peptidyl-prolyl cis-trans isomerase A (cyclophilin A)